MRTRNRHLQFDALEQLRLLSSVHPSLAHQSHTAKAVTSDLPPYVRAVVRDARHYGRNVTVQVLVAPGTSTSYEISFKQGPRTITTDIVIPAFTPPGPTPG